jgi:hypothetical protein
MPSISKVAPIGVRRSTKSSLPLSQADRAEECAIGLIRNFGRGAEAEALRMARRCASRRDEDGESLWHAIAICAASPKTKTLPLNIFSDSAAQISCAAIS